MLKTGIYRREDLTLRALDGFLGRRKFVAVTLYPEIAASELPERDRLLERILSRFPAANGTYKRTANRRFDAFDKRVVETLRASIPPGSPFSVHDVAVSDGRTAVDFFRIIADAIDVDLSFLASDGAPDVEAVSSSATSLVLILDPESGTPLQVISRPFVFNVQQPESPVIYPVNRLVLFALLRTRVRSLLRQWRNGDDRLTISRFRLLSPECLRLLTTDPRFSFKRYDILAEPAGSFDLVRAMNVLNHSYFSDAQISIAIQRIHESLAPGGLLVTGSNEDAGSSVNGATYERTERGFRPVWVAGAGSPVHSLVTATVATAGG